MTKRALLVGCNYPNSESPLSGCVNDVKNMYQVLVARYGFEEENVGDENSSDPPTGANMKKWLSQLVADSQEGDVLYFHFSGHGGQVSAESGEPEDDGKDEAIYPSDMNFLTDDDFRLLLTPLAPGVAFTFVSDSCNSGGLLDGQEVQIGVADDGEVGDETEQHDGEAAAEAAAVAKQISVETLQAILSERTGQEVTVGTIRTTLYDTFGEDASATVKVFVNHIKERLDEGISEEEIVELYGETGYNAAAYLKQKMDDESIDNDEYFRASQEVDGPVNRSGHANAKPAPEDLLPPSTGVLISACQSNQLSEDLNPTGDPAEAFGALSHSILQVIEESQGNITNAYLVNAIRKKLMEEGRQQRPCLFCSEEALEMPFICEPVA